MSPASTAIRTSTPWFSATKLANFRLIPRIETYPHVLEFAQTPLGKGALLAVFCQVLRNFVPDILSWVLIVVALILTTFLPGHRRVVLAIGAVIGTLKATLNFGAGFTLKPVVMDLAVMALGMMLFWCARRWPQSRFGRRPIVFLLSGFGLLILCASSVPAAGRIGVFLWSAIGAAVTYVWFIAYALTDKSAKPAQEATVELAALRPVWGSTATPFPKGAAYLRRIEARNAEQLAIAQLKGLKLLVWAILLALLVGLWNKFFHGYLQIPTSADALTMSVKGTPAAWHLRWESLILAFFESILSVSIMGHQFIAVCRMAGFNALRNTYRPLSSTTISEFFNRFYYYFKELLVDFFFYPAFLRYFKSNKRLRMIFATFAAAFFGNTFYHFTRDWAIIRDDGLLQAMKNYEASLFYCFVLAAALSISQLRERGPRPTGFLRGHLLPVTWVCLFYCVLNVFVTDERVYPFVEYVKYLASLFFIRL